MPDSDCLEICKGIRNWHIPVIFLTAWASDTDRIVGLQLGETDYIEKPFFIRELITRIILRLRQKAEADPANPLLIRSVRGFG